MAGSSNGAISASSVPRDAYAGSGDDRLISARIAAAMPLLSPIHQRMGQFVLANLFRAATMRIDELSTAVGASVATANRFARALGFDGYPAFRDALVRGFEATLAPVERLRHSLTSPASALQVMEAAFEQAENNLRTSRDLLRTIDAGAVEAAVAAIIAAPRVFIVGYGASAFLSGLMEHGLTPYCANVQSLALAGGPSHAARKLFTANPEDLLIAIAFPRYVEDTVRLSAQARSRGVKVLALTDGPHSPLAPHADLLLQIATHRRLAANSDAAVLMIIEALCDAVAYQIQRPVELASGFAEFVLPWLVQVPGTPVKTQTSLHSADNARSP